MAQKRKHPDDSVGADPSEAAIYRSSPVEDRDSIFIGLFSPTIAPKGLQKLKEVKNASHCMVAWRRESNQQSLTSTKQYVTGHDDDGEKYGGKRVEQVMVNMKAVGACVVARWYGGTMLGPVRFTHIETCASEAVRSWLNHTGEEQAKKRKVEEEAAEKEKLVKALGARDQSIGVLRALAVEKETQAKEAKETDHGKTRAVEGQAVVVDAKRENAPPSSSNPSSSQPAVIDYDAMTVDRLRALDKARDATLSFLLKRIDKAEAALAAIDKKKEQEERPP
ncbi:hypothetical protein WHR41_08186 [Cladosporium halotolerans]|uniref:Impact N-terminal domain-containing protein n=1 Tax=Cladosporium halotolerans TaxID=1052096 RepID=A0AB34KGK9_9PEZI